MKKLQVEVPESLADIKLHQYQELVLMGSNASEEELVSIMLELDRKAVRRLSNGVMSQLVDHVNKLVTTSNKELVKTFKIGKTKFGFEPNLDEADWGVIIDAETHLGDWENMHYALAALYRPIVAEDHKGRYKLEPYEAKKEYAEMMRFCPMNVVQGVQVFFCNLLTDLGTALLNYMENPEMIQQLVQHSSKGGDDIIKSLQSLRDLTSELTKQQEYLLDKHSLT